MRGKFYFDQKRFGLDTDSMALAARNAFPLIGIAVGSEEHTNVDGATRARIEHWIERCTNCPPSPP